MGSSVRPEIQDTTAQTQDPPLSLRERIIQEAKKMEEEQRAASPDGDKKGPDSDKTRGSLLRFLFELPSTIERGVNRAVQEGAQSVDSFAQWVAGTKVGKALLGQRIRPTRGGKREIYTLVDFLDEGKSLFPRLANIDLGPAPSTAGGAVVESIVQFTVGLVGVGKVFAPFKVVKKGVSLASFGNLTLQGAVVDAALFDPYEARLADFVAEHGPEFAQPIAEFMQADEDDSEAMARLKAALEGAAIGGTVDAFLAALRGLRKIRKVKNGKGDEELARSVVDDLEQADELAEAARTGQGSDEIRIKQNDDGTFSPTDGKSDGPAFNSRGDAEAVSASANDAAANSRLPRGELSPDMKEQVVNRAQELAQAKNAKDLRRLADGTIFNFNYAQTPKQARAMIQSIADLMPGVFEEVSQRGVKTEEITRALADDILAGVDADQAVDLISRAYGANENIREILLATRIYQHSLADQIYRLGRRADRNPDDLLAVDELSKALDTLFNVSVDLDGTVSKIAGGLQQQQIPISVSRLSRQSAKREAESASSPRSAGNAPENVDNLPRDQNIDLVEQRPARSTAQAPGTRKVTEGLTQEQIQTLARRVRLAQGDPNAIIAEVKALRMIAKAEKQAGADIVSRGRFRKIMSSVQLYRMINMLSGVKTHLVNIISNASVAFQRPAEIWWAGAMSSNLALQREGSDLMTGSFLALRDSWGAARKAFSEGTNSLDPAFRTDEMVHNFNSDNWLIRIFKVPLRLLMSEDEFFKNVGYISNVRAQSLRLAREDANAMLSRGQLKPDDMGEFLGRRVSQDLEDAFALDAASGRIFGTNQKALEFGRVSTFTNSLDDGLGPMNLGLGIQNLAKEFPPIRIIVPFIRTPINLFRYAHQRTPLLNRVNRRAHQMYKAGGEQRALIHAQTQMGGAVYATAALLYASKNMTGGGPEDPELRAAWLGAGNQPYSVKVPGLGWVSYRRMDPVATPLGLMADFMESYGEIEEAWDTGTVEAAATSILASITSNLASKTFFRSITEFMQASTSGNASQMQRFLRNFESTLVPFSVAQQQLAAGIDPVFRESRTFLDNLRVRTPFLSTTVEAQRNVFGEKILRPPGLFNRSFNPMTIMKPSSDTAMAAFVEMGRGFSMPRTQTAIDRIKFTDRRAFNNGTGQSPYDRWMELLTTTGNGMPQVNLRDQIENLINSDVWTRLPAGSELSPGGARWLLVNNMIQAYRRAAMEKVRSEYPRLHRAMLEERAVSAVSQFGDDEVERVRSLIQHNISR